jgi:GAF domain-containing protein
VAEEQWTRDRDRFVDDVLRARTDGREPLRDHGFGLGPLAQQFATLTYSLLDATTVGEVLDQVVHATARIVTGAEVVSITLRDRNGRFYTPVGTHPIAAELDQLQYDTGEGPCVDAALDPGPAMASSTDLARESSWPTFGPGAARRGIRAVLCTALLLPPGAPNLSGALNIYSRQAGGLDEADRSAALLLATHASLALAHTDSVEQGQLEREHLRRAIDSRDVIGQAKGILMARRGIGSGEAFDILRKSSQDLND